jgi:aminoglycoside 2'-N-acetyltransferase I
MTLSRADLVRVRVRRLRTAELSPARLAALRELVDAAFGGDRDEPFDDHDWQHALGGVHAVAELDDRFVAHAAVVPRELHAGGRPLRTGYVEAVGVHPDLQRRGLGTLVMRAADEHIAEAYELGGLGTGDHGFYDRLGWRTWRGPSFVRAPDGDRPTPDEDGFIMVLTVPSTPDWLDLDAPISCEWRAGDDW